MSANRPQQRVSARDCHLVLAALILLLQRSNPFAVYDIYKAATDNTYQVSQRSAAALKGVGLVTDWNAQTRRVTMSAEVGIVVRAAVYRHGEGVAVRSHDQVVAAIGK